MAYNFTYLDRYLESLLDFGFPLYDCTVFVEHKEVYRRRGGKIGAPGSRYFLYSCSKPVTCAAALTLLEAGKYLLDDPVSAYLPEFGEVQVEERLPGGGFYLRPPKAPIRIRHLFTMTAGLNYNLRTPAILEAIEKTGGRAPTREIARAIAKTPLSFDPGDRWQYSLCHDVLAALTEVIAGEKFRDYVKRVIFDPLGMTNTGYTVPAGCGLEAVNTQYRYNDEKHIAEETEKKVTHILGPEYDSGGAGMVSCPEDYILFADAMANGGIGKSGAQILSPATIDLMRTNFLTEEQRRTFTWAQLRGYSYGLGVRTMVDRAAGGSISPLGEFGWGGAAGALVYISPEKKAAVYLAQHTLNPHEDKVLPELRNVIFAAIG